MKILKLTIFIYVLTCSVHGQKTNLSIGSGINYGVTPPAYSLNFHYTNPTIDIVKELIGFFGDSCVRRGEDYYWEQIMVKKLSKKPLDIMVIRRIYDYDPPKDDHEFYDVIIKKDDKDFLRDFNFINRLRVKSIFRRFAEPKP